jgi:tRNA(Ile)-lysidine synthase
MWNNVEHQVWNKLKEHQLENEPVYLLAVSGGLDSMVLLQVMKKIKPQAKLVMMHYHHGPGSNLKYRDECVDLLNKVQSDQLILEVGKSVLELNSENEFREARLAFFEKIKSKYNVSYYFTAHHLDDVLETRLIKMIRGTGLEGLEAFEEWNQKCMRPFFEMNKSALQKYAHENQVSWLDDPTNLENDYLRNWIRNVWLPQLDQKMPGGLENIAKSLQNMINESASGWDRYAEESPRYVTRIDQTISIDRSWFFSFNTKDQLIVLIRVINESFQCGFSTNQIKEVLKRLDKNQNEHIFNVASINWVINAQTIMLTYTK